MSVKVLNQILCHLIIVIILFSCKKDASETSCSDIEPDYSHLEGNYHCQVDYNYNYSDSFEDLTYDRIMRTYVENDSLHFLNWTFPISYEYQTEFLIDTIFGSEAASVTALSYSSNFDSLTFTTSWSPLTQAPSTNYTYQGVLTNLEESVVPHTYIDILEGHYELDYQYVHFQNSEYLDQSEVYFITKSGLSLEVDDQQFYLPLFHSWAEGISSYPEVDSKREFSIYWSIDSIYFDDLRTVGVWNEADTIRDTFFGPKMN